MKKIISLFLIVVLCFSSVTAFAKTPLLDTTQLMMGDANKDGKVTAGDARTVLRISAKLDAQDSVNLYSVDADGNGKITASDARTILRVAANLSEFVYGFDGNGVPCALNVLKSTKYSADVTFYDDITGDSGFPISFAKNNNNFYFSSDSVEDMMGGGTDTGSGGLQLDIVPKGIMKSNEKKYIIIEIAGEKGVMEITKALADMAGLDMAEFEQMIKESNDMITSILPDNAGAASRTTLNDENVFCYDYEIESNKYKLYVSENGKLISICDALGSSDKPLVSFDKITDGSSDKYFDIDSYAFQW